MLPLKNRLKLNRDFEKIFKNSYSYYGKFLGVRFKKNQLKINRFGFLVGLKVDKQAVVRNLIKRRLRGALNKLQDQLKSGHDLIIIAQPSIKQADFKEIEADLQTAFFHLKLLDR